VKRIARLAALALAATVFAVAGLVAFGAAVGRFHVIPADAGGARVAAGQGSVVVVVPVPAAQLHEGDTVYARLHNDHDDALYRVVGVDSWTGVVYALDAHGGLAALDVGDTAGRVSRSVPYVGVPYRFVAGPVQWLVLLAGAGMLVVRMARRPRSADHRQRRSRWALRLGAAVLALLGMFAMSAEASFDAQVSPTHATSTPNMELDNVSGADTPGNRLTVGATDLAPGDQIQRALTLTVSSDTTAALMTGMTLTVTASPASTLRSDATDGMKIWVRTCHTSGGASGWIETGSSAPYTYSCTKGAGGTWHDLLNSSPTDDPTAVPTANTCATSTGGTGSYRSLSELGSGYTLTNLPTLSAGTSLHLVITMCLPTNAGNTFQSATGTALTFSFDGVQRAGTNR
jgi:hypothetical protein